MENVYVVEALRTPFGSFGGCLADVAAPQLAAQVISALVERTGIDPAGIDQAIIGQVLSGAAAQAPARQAMRAAGLPDEVDAMTINKVCGSGLKAMMLAADSIRLGDAQLIIAGGMENMSQAPYALPKARFGQRMGNGEVLDLMIHDGLLDPYSGKHMGVIAQARADHHELSREAQDEYAIESYRRSQAASASGRLAAEIVPVTVKTRKGELTIGADEEPSNVSFDKLLTLRPAFGKDGTITAGNASTINDGAALALLAGEEAVSKYNLKPKARMIGYASNSLHPDLFTDAPIGAIRKAVQKAGLTLEQIDLFEINEAFAAVPMMAMKELGIEPQKVNINGGAVSIGHPLGASGARVVVTLIEELRQRQARYGLATLCIGGGEAVAAVFERI